VAFSTTRGSTRLAPTLTIWTGIGAVGAFAVGVFALGEPPSAQRMIAVALIVAGMALMKSAPQ
jgi:quaternary ammonium compound-resistance protein SugE